MRKWQRKLISIEGDAAKPYIEICKEVYASNGSMQKTADLLGVARGTVVKLFKEARITNKQAAIIEKRKQQLHTAVRVVYERRMA